VVEGICAIPTSHSYGVITIPIAHATPISWKHPDDNAQIVQTENYYYANQNVSEEACRLELPMEVNDTPLMVYVYYIPPSSNFLKVLCLLDPTAKVITLYTYLKKIPDTHLVEYPSSADPPLELFDHLITDSTDLEDLVIASTKTTCTHQGDLYNYITTSWDLKDESVVLNEIEVLVSCDIPEHMPIPIRQQTFVFPITHVAKNLDKFGTDGNSVKDSKSPCTPCIPVIKPPRPLGPPIILSGSVFPNASNLGQLNLMIITSRSGYEFSFVIRVFGIFGGETAILEETRTPWSPQNAVTMQKPDIRRYGSSKMQVQIAADIRLPHVPGPPLTYLLSQQ
jgi:hypothetical protein